jgi:succinate-acetate transporter protein
VVTDMLDIIFVALTVLFFAVAIGYVVACDRLMK